MGPMRGNAFNDISHFDVVGGVCLFLFPYRSFVLSNFETGNNKERLSTGKVLKIIFLKAPHYKLMNMSPCKQVTLEWLIFLASFDFLSYFCKSLILNLFLKEGSPACPRKVRDKELQAKNATYTWRNLFCEFFITT